MVRSCGIGAEMAKCDIKSAFWLLPIHPNDFELLGFTFDGEFYMNRALPMGCSVSCAAFEKFSSFLEWVLQQCTGLQTTKHYLDDYLLTGPAESGQCAQLLQAFVELSGELGVPLAHEKKEGPTSRLIFLSIELDTNQQTSILPGKKLEELRVR